ncbi:MFS multidrug transporter [Blastomyces gilchristii SLH14081]|uniref:MFS multidrug transporter n=1 Tax=Blastomyces gilchristii (strain SLH14081) TaxID=559298 RepID=A0A179UER1_BLAGS|nr:MFS multidrug transporter [Blastomyces gilchristii SLH14081]OAT05002.1 MFS multidrug transporter [Blastomyces gilchristii SLH14081]
MKSPIPPRPTAALEAYTTETQEGRIIKPVRSNVTGKIEDRTTTSLLSSSTIQKTLRTGAKRGNGKVAEEFDIGEIVDLLTITVCGIGFQSVEPMSEMFGRKPVYVPTLSVAVVFLITEYIVSGAVWALVTFTAPETSTVDTYQHQATSALAAKTFLRSMSFG